MIYRPENQLILFGLKKFLNELINLYEQKKLPNKILLSGQKGLGKCTMAYHLINYALSEGEEFSYNTNQNEINPLNRSYKLIQNNSNTNFDLIDVSSDKRNIDIDQIRKGDAGPGVRINGMIESTDAEHSGITSKGLQGEDWSHAWTQSCAQALGYRLAARSSQTDRHCFAESAHA